MTIDPFVKFQHWLEEAKKTAMHEPTAMCLATADAKGKPSARMVLLKGVDHGGFVFYTNLESHKSTDLKQNPNAALCFYWMPMHKQVRIEGRVEQVSDKEADDYFASREHESQIGAWASQQSRPLESRGVLVEAVSRETIRFGIHKVPRPPFWSGWRVVPSSIEFWQEGPARLHERELFTRKGEGWDVVRLYP